MKSRSISSALLDVRHTPIATEFWVAAKFRYVPQPETCANLLWARSGSVSGTAMPSALAAWRLVSNSIWWLSEACRVGTEKALCDRRTVGHGRELVPPREGESFMSALKISADY